jgi:hypothetical protein
MGNQNWDWAISEFICTFCLEVGIGVNMFIQCDLLQDIYSEGRELRYLVANTTHGEKNRNVFNNRFKMKFIWITSSFMVMMVQKYLFWKQSLLKSV